MFNSSLRRAAQTCPNATLATRNAPRVLSRPAGTFTARGHQRRHSSSKPPAPPNDGSSSIPTASVKQVGAPRSAEKRPGTESRLSKRKGPKSDKTEQTRQIQDAKANEWTYSLPFVPSTQHLHPKDVYVAAFFSTHRPISISGILPETQLEDIDKIFEPRPRKPKTGSGPAEVIYTLSNAVQNLDEHVQAPSQQDPTVERKADLIKTLTQQNNQTGNTAQVQHVDGYPHGAGQVKIIIEEIARRFRPFNTPPAPVPAPDIDFQNRDAIAAEADKAAENYESLQDQQLEVEIQMQDLTIQQIDPRSDILTIKAGNFFTPHQSPITEPGSQSVKGGRSRRGMYLDPSRYRQNLKYQLISVKRQRKLKMKKHKYKKLMRKTRNLRRRQDKL